MQSIQLKTDRASMEDSSDRFDKTNSSNHQYRKPRLQRIGGIGLALVGAAILVYSLQFFLFHPMTARDEYIGSRLWVVGSWLLGGGVTLSIARPWVAVLVGFFAPAFTFAIAMLLFFVLIFLSPMFS